jgi:hypothetical protein
MMKVLSLLGKDKNALSNVVGYVLLISVTMSISVLVFGWLRFYVSESDIETCPDSVSIIIENYTCPTTPSFNVTLKNKGLFKVDGYVLRFHNKSNSEFGFYLLDGNGMPISPGNSFEKKYLLTEHPGLDNIKLIEVQPFIKDDDGNKITCKYYASQKVTCP